MRHRFDDLGADGRVICLAVVAGLAFAVSMLGCATPGNPSPGPSSGSGSPQAGSEIAAVTPRPPPSAPPTTLAKPPPKSPAAVAPAAQQPPKSPAAVAPAAQPSTRASTPADIAKPKSPPLDLGSLEQRLKDTDAIGVLTKITLKNQVDDLLNQFRAFYQGKLKTDLANLRRSYDLLVLKVLTLLQDGDQALAKAIVASREAIWGILSDPAKFATI